MPAPAAALSLLPGGEMQEVDESQLHCASSFCPMGVSPSAYQVLLGGVPALPGVTLAQPRQRLGSFSPIPLLFHTQSPHCHKGSKHG